MNYQLSVWREAQRQAEVRLHRPTGKQSFASRTKTASLVLNSVGQRPTLELRHGHKAVSLVSLAQGNALWLKIALPLYLLISLNAMGAPQDIALIPRLARQFAERWTTVCNQEISLPNAGSFARITPSQSVISLPEYKASFASSHTYTSIMSQNVSTLPEYKASFDPSRMYALAVSQTAEVLPKYRTGIEASRMYASALTHAQIGMPIAPEKVASIRMNVIYSGLVDGTFNLRSPEWRPYLAYMIENPERRDPDTIFGLMLVGCAGNNDTARIALALKWSKEFEDGRYAGAVEYYTARYAFLSGSYKEAILRCRDIAKNYPPYVVKAMLLEALSAAHLSDTKTAHAVLSKIIEEYPDSPDIPEVRYMEAWIAVEEMRDDDAKVILGNIVSNYPGTPTARKARQMLQSLNEE